MCGKFFSSSPQHQCRFLFIFHGYQVSFILTYSPVTHTGWWLFDISRPLPKQRQDRAFGNSSAFVVLQWELIIGCRLQKTSNTSVNWTNFLHSWEGKNKSKNCAFVFDLCFAQWHLPISLYSLIFSAVFRCLRQCCSWWWLDWNFPKLSKQFEGVLLGNKCHPKLR